VTTRECVHLVTGSYFRLRKKDGGHAIRSPVRWKSCTLYHYVCIDAELLAIEFWTRAWKRICYDTHASVAWLPVV